MIITIAGILIDILTSNLIFFNFSIGSFLAICAYFLNISIPSQIIIFLVSGNVLFIITYKYVRRKLKDIPTVSPYEKRYIGMTINIKNNIDKEGQVLFQGIYWTVVTDTPLKVGDIVKILGIEGNKLIVKKLEGGKCY